MQNQYTNFANSTKSTVQTSPIIGRETEMVQNNAGGFTFEVSPWTRLDRFLVLGTESNTYYQSAPKITEDNAKAIIRLIQADGVKVVARIAEVSDAGRAPKNDPALFALALAMTYGDEATKSAAYVALPKVARIGTHVLHLAEYVNSLRGWGRGIRRAFSNWYLDQPTNKLAMNLVKYANRDGWTHRDILRLAHPSATGTYNQLLAFAADKGADFSGTEVEGFMNAVAEVKTASAKDAVKLISEFKLPREVLPTELLNEKKIWEALLPHMGVTALVRNLATMTRVGLLTPMSTASKDVIARLNDKDVIKKSRIHPIQMLSAKLTYGRGVGVRGTNTWTPNAAITGALENGFYNAFDAVVPSNKNHYLALDVSGSMGWSEIAGVPGLTPATASTVMSMVTARTEPYTYTAGFSTGMKDLKISSADTLESAMRKTSDQNFGGTDCSAPMRDALAKGIEVDTFVVYTDNETYAGAEHPVQSLTKYRKAMNRPAKLIVVGFTATNFTIADPKDAGMMDVVGFDSAAPAIMADFSRE